MQKLFGFKHVIFIAVVLFLSLWTWMLRYEVMRLERAHFLLDRLTGKTYIGWGSWREIKLPVVSKLPPIEEFADELLAEEAREKKRSIAEDYDEILKERLNQPPKSADSTNRRTKP